MTTRFHRADESLVTKTAAKTEIKLPYSSPTSVGKIVSPSGRVTYYYTLGNGAKMSYTNREKFRYQLRNEANVREAGKLVEELDQKVPDHEAKTAGSSQELRELRTLLSDNGYDPKEARKLQSKGMGLFELEHILKTTRPGGMGSLEHTHGIKHLKNASAIRVATRFLIAADKAKVKKWMSSNVKDHVDGRTGEVNTTSLAESAAHEFDQSEWLDDSDHWVWDLSVLVGDA